HASHCFDYLRQAIMCSGDMALEKAALKDQKPVRSVNGWGVTHQCRDWDAMFEWVERHRT
ncbi:hypothetical protein NA57DRAFT_15870, partial [Rhizodiscina lignyota]